MDNFQWDKFYDDYACFFLLMALTGWLDDDFGIKQMIEKGFDKQGSEEVSRENKTN